LAARPSRDVVIAHRRPLHSDSTQEVLKHLHRLWGFTVRLEAVDEDGKVELVGECPATRR
jgi:stage V sporulation protein R